MNPIFLNNIGVNNNNNIVMQDSMNIPDWMQKKDPEFSYDNAKELINDYCIRKHDTRNDEEILYRMVEIESYYYNSEHPEKDSNTFPRDCKVGEWFFHYAGVDIAYNTVIDGDEVKKFGGVLIRGIEIFKMKDNKWTFSHAIGGPMLCMKEIFSHTHDMPKLQKMPGNISFSNKNIEQTKRIGFKDFETNRRAIVAEPRWFEKKRIIIKEKKKDVTKIVYKEVERNYNPKIIVD